MSLLTLDETTLFYFSLPVPKKTGVIKNWAAAVDSYSSNASARSGTSKSRVPALTIGSTCSTVTSTLTDAVLISMDRKPTHDITPDDDDRVGGLVDEDETRGEERNAAASSPVKGKMRVTSSVSESRALVSVISRCESWIVPRLSSKWRIPQCRLSHRFERVARNGQCNTFLLRATTRADGGKFSSRRISRSSLNNQTHGPSTTPWRYQPCRRSGRSSTATRSRARSLSMVQSSLL